jgi:hypothetical protein
VSAQDWMVIVGAALLIMIINWYFFADHSASRAA